MESYHTVMSIKDKKCIEALSGLACALLEVGNFEQAGQGPEVFHEGMSGEAE